MPKMKLKEKIFFSWIICQHIRLFVFLTQHKLKENFTFPFVQTITIVCSTNYFQEKKRNFLDLRFNSKNLESFLMFFSFRSAYDRNVFESLKGTHTHTLNSFFFIHSGCFDFISIPPTNTTRNQIHITVCSLMNFYYQESYKK